MLIMKATNFRTILFIIALIAQVRGTRLAVDWYNIFGSPTVDTTEIFWAVSELSDQNFIATGFHDPKKLPVFYLVKTDNRGNLIWERKYPGYHFEKAVGKSLLKAENGSFYIGASSSLILGHFNADGDTIWTRDINAKKLGTINSIIQMNNNELMVLGGKAKLPVLFDDPDNYGFIVRMGTNSDSIALTETGFGSSANSLFRTSDNGFIFGGDKIVVKSDSVAEVHWKKEFMSPQFVQERYFDVIESSQGGYVATGSYYAASEFWEVRVRKLDTSGNSEWEIGFRHKAVGYDICEVPGTGYAVLGKGPTSESEIYLIDYSGELLHHLKSEDVEKDDWSFLNIEPTSDSGLIVCGLSEIYDGIKHYQDALILKLEIDTTPTAILTGPSESINTVALPVISQSGKVLHLRSPDFTRSNLLFLLYSSSGRLLLSKRFEKAGKNIGIDVSGFVPGIYPYRLLLGKYESYGTVFIR